MGRALRVAALSSVLFGAGPTIWTITSTMLRQSMMPGYMLGCVSAVFLTVNMGARRRWAGWQERHGASLPAAGTG